MVIPSHVYVDVDVVNNDLTSDISAPALRFQETRDTPYIEGDSADYLCSIIRFSIQTGSSLPVFIPRIELGQSDVNKTVYPITIVLTGDLGGESVSVTGVVSYSKTDDTAPTPEPLNSQDISSTDYYMYNYQYVIKMFNRCLSGIWTQVCNRITNSSDRQALRGLAVPFFELDVDRLKIALNQDVLLRFFLKSIK